MCGIAGIFNVKTREPVQASLLTAMIETLRHRGPDESGVYVRNEIGLAHSRLSIIDLSGGKQPIYNEDRSICVIFNGEIFNYIELRDVLRKKGHVFYTSSDTEVIVHAYEEYGESCFRHFNGQFAIALWDNNKKKLILARDRVGIRPLFYSVLADGGLIFASEMKSLFRHGAPRPELDPAGINQVFTLWVNIPPRTVFKNISELAPGHIMTVSETGTRITRFWKLSFPDADDYEDRPIQYYMERLHEELYNAVTIRLRADVPVAAYLSGGLDSSIITSLVKKYHNNDLMTFSVSFKDSDYDESSYQNEMVRFLGTHHRMISVDYDSIGRDFSDVVWYAEMPMIRTAPTPLYSLSGLVRRNGIKVVLTGEGADEIFGGYNIFKEDKIRRFWARCPESKKRPKLLNALYPYVSRDKRARHFWQMFFKKGLQQTDDPYYSHKIRWNNTAGLKEFFNDDFRAGLNEKEVYEDLEKYMDPDIMRWHPLCRAQYLETTLFMSGYLLSSQGDRMMMGNSIEGRFPFLDYRVIEFAATIPPHYKMNSLNEKYILKKTFAHMLPESIIYRDKQPYRAPINRCFSGNNAASRMLSDEWIKKYGYFNHDKVALLRNKLNQNIDQVSSARDDMALAAIVSTQLLHHHFIDTSSV